MKACTRVPMGWLTFDVEGGVGGVALLAGRCTARHTLEAPGIQTMVNVGELEVPALLEAPLRVGHGLAVVQPAVAHVAGAAGLAAQHGTAPVQGILRFGLFGELDG